MNSVILGTGLGEVGMQSGADILAKGGSSLDAAIAATMTVEANPDVPAVGISGAPNILGELEQDAAVMDGDTLNAGSIGALKGYNSAVWVARKVMDKLPHVMLAGDGAARFANECGAERSKGLTADSREKYLTWLRDKVPEEVQSTLADAPLTEYIWPDGTRAHDNSSRDTVVFLAKDESGKISAAASTSGWFYKYPGRIGDSPIIGAGLYADSKYGACCCTWTGEMAMRCVTSRSVVLYMKKGATVQEALHEAVDDLRQLKGGHLGKLLINAIDRKGQPYGIATFKEGSNYYFWSDSDMQIKTLSADIDLIERHPGEPVAG